jgi:hypothetical protein
MGAFGGLSQVMIRPPVLIQVVCKRPRAPCPGLVVGDLRTKYQKLTQIAHVTSPGHDETKLKHFTVICMWAKKYILKLFFFLPGPFQGGHFLGGIIYLAALDLGPVALSLRPALLTSIPVRVLRMNSGTMCMCARKQLQYSRCDRTKGCG